MAVSIIDAGLAVLHRHSIERSHAATGEPAMPNSYGAFMPTPKSR
jgi:hypothetical protein